MKRLLYYRKSSPDDDTGTIEMERIDDIEIATLICVGLIVLIILLN